MPYKNPSLLFRPKALNCRSIGLPDGCTFPALSIRKIWKGDAVLLIPGLVTATDTPGQLSKATNGFLPTQEAISPRRFPLIRGIPDCVIKLIAPVWISAL